MWPFSRRKKSAWEPRVQEEWERLVAEFPWNSLACVCVLTTLQGAAKGLIPAETMRAIARLDRDEIDHVLNYTPAEVRKPGPPSAVILEILCLLLDAVPEEWATEQLEHAVVESAGAMRSFAEAAS